MKIKIILSSVLSIGLLACGLTACMSEKCESCEKADKQVKLMSEAKVSKADAEKTALAKVPNGTIKEGELEKEDGKLIWSFDIATPDSKDITEVAVNAITGEVVSVEKETPEEQAKEKAEDAAKEKKDKD